MLAIEESTGLTPQALQNRPVLIGYEGLVSKAYTKLANRRQIGMATNPIQLSEIKAYVDMFGLPNISLELFEELIGIIDSKHLELINGNQSSGRSTDKPGGRGV